MDFHPAGDALWTANQHKYTAASVIYDTKMSKTIWERTETWELVFQDSPGYKDVGLQQQANDYDIRQCDEKFTTTKNYSSYTDEVRDTNRRVAACNADAPKSALRQARACISALSSCACIFSANSAR